MDLSPLQPFRRWLDRWQLAVAGEPFATDTSDLLAVVHESGPAMLKLARHAEEARGNALMAWWEGDGAARAIAHAENALLMVRAEGTTSLAELARQGADDQAARILCGVAARLHRDRGKPLPELIPLPVWFEPLLGLGRSQGGILSAAAAAAGGLLREPTDRVALHGDLHHGNVLDFGPAAGWLAIDPKGLLGESSFDYVNMLRNPDAVAALERGRLDRQADVICRAAGIERKRLLRWLLAFAGLSAVWLIDEGAVPSCDIELAVLAAAALE